MTRVLIADDDPAARIDVRRALEADGGFTVCAEAGDAPAAVHAAMRTAPDVGLLDVRMPGSGVAAAWEIAARRPEMKIVMLTVSDDERDLMGAIRAGACGYLLKDMDPARLPQTLRDVLAGSAALPGHLTARLLDELRDRGPRRRGVRLEGVPVDLTSREWHVLELLRQGRSTAEIARRLVVTPATVRSHVASLVRKLGVADRRALLELFRDGGGALPEPLGAGEGGAGPVQE